MTSHAQPIIFPPCYPEPCNFPESFSVLKYNFPNGKSSRHKIKLRFLPFVQLFQKAVGAQIFISLFISLTLNIVGFFLVLVTNEQAKEFSFLSHQKNNE